MNALPVRTRLHPLSDLRSHVTHLAQANGLTLRDLPTAGLSPTQWEHPDPAGVAAIAALTGESVATIQAATTSAHYPPLVSSRRATGRRWGGLPASCPACPGPAPREANLHLFVLCPRCRGYLTDGQHPTTTGPPPPALVEVQAGIRDAVASANHGQPSASVRLARLETLVRTLPHALTATWPALSPGEDLDSRHETVRFLEAAHAGPYTPVYPPPVMATFLLIAWPRTADAAATEVLRISCTANQDHWLTERLGAQLNEPPGSDQTGRALRTATTDGVAAVYRGLPVEPRHLPFPFGTAEEDLLLPQRLHPWRSALTISLLREINPALRGRTPAQAAECLRMPLSATAARFVNVLEGQPTQPHIHQVLTEHLRLDGLIDYAARRGSLRGLHTIPPRSLRDLPATARALPGASQLGATWAWIDATRAPITAGPNPDTRRDAIRTFDAALTAEGRLVLRDFWHQHVTATDDLEAAVRDTVNLSVGPTPQALNSRSGSQQATGAGTGRDVG